MNSDLDTALLALSSLVTDRLRTMVEWLCSKGLSELAAINLILDAAESILDETPIVYLSKSAKLEQ